MVPTPNVSFPLSCLLLPIHMFLYPILIPQEPGRANWLLGYPEAPTDLLQLIILQGVLPNSERQGKFAFFI